MYRIERRRQEAPALTVNRSLAVFEFVGYDVPTLPDGDQMATVEYIESLRTALQGFGSGVTFTEPLTKVTNRVLFELDVAAAVYIGHVLRIELEQTPETLPNQIGCHFDVELLSGGRFHWGTDVANWTPGSVGFKDLDTLRAEAVAFLYAAAPDYFAEDAQAKYMFTYGQRTRLQGLYGVYLFDDDGLSATPDYPNDVVLDDLYYERGWKYPDQDIEA